MLLMFRLYASPHRVSIAMRRGSCELGRGAFSYRDNPSSVLLYLRRPGDCALITVFVRPAFRETVVGKEPQAEIVDLTPSSHHKNTPIAVQTHARLRL